MIPRGVHGSGPGMPNTSLPRFVGCVLLRVDELQHTVGVDVGRQRELDDEACAVRVVVQRVHGGLDLGLSGRGGQLHAEGRDPDIGAVAVLPGNVRMAAWVVADQDRAEPRSDALGM